MFAPSYVYVVKELDGKPNNVGVVHVTVVDGFESGITEGQVSPSTVGQKTSSIVLCHYKSYSIYK